MLIKHFARGVGRGAGPVEYVLSDQKILEDENGNKVIYIRDPKPEVVRGNPELTIELIDSIDRRWKYTSGVISFAAEDNPTIEQQNEAMDEYEKLAFAGMDKDQFNVLWVKQTDTGRCELHMVIPRTELTTSKAFNPAPPGSQKDFDSLIDSMNFKYGWARPNDPDRKRIVQPGREALTDIARIRAGLPANPDKKQMITDWLLSRVEMGVVKNRSDIVASLSELGEITRQGKDYVSVRIEGEDKPTRLKGALYDEQFRPERIEELTRIAIERKTRSREQENSGIDLERSGSARKDLDAFIAKRSSYNQGRFGKVEQGIELDVKPAPSSDEKKPEVSLAIAFSSPDRLPDDLRRDLRLDDLPSERSREKSAGNTANNRSIDQPILRNASRQGQLHEKQWFDTLKNNLGETYDRARKAVISGVESAFNTVRNGYESVARSNLALATASSNIEQVGRTFDAQADRAFGKLKMNRDDELFRFKREINLVEYAEVSGYEIDKKQSSKASKVMRRGEDKIIVSTDKDGTGIYFSVRDDSDNGSIIDFIQKREKKNLGEVRKELRPWIGVSTGRPVKARKPVQQRPEKPIAIDGSEAKTNAAWMRLKPYKGDYLTKERAIAYKTLEGVNLRQDERGNVCFPHYGENSVITGWEVKNKDFTGFSAGGKKQIGIYKASKDAKLETGRLVIVESGIDALSFKELHARPTDMIVSVGGEMSPEQMERISKAIKTAPEVIIATDKDAGGEKIAKRLLELRSDCERLLPQNKDWNADLQEKHELSRKKRPDLEI